MEKLRQTRPTTVTKETKSHLAAKNQDDMEPGDDNLMTPKAGSENDEKDMDPPGLTESEDEDESEEETEDEDHSSCLPTPRPTITITEASFTSSDSSDEETQEFRTHKEMKSKLHRNKVKHLFHPP